MAYVATFAELRVQVARRAGAWATLADVDEALAFALAGLGVTPVDPTAMVDSDIVSVAAAQRPQLLDVAEWRVLETALNNCDEASLRNAGIDPKSPMVATLPQRVERLFERVRQTYGVGLGTLSATTLSLDLAAKGNDVTTQQSGF